MQTFLVLNKLKNESLLKFIRQFYQLYCYSDDKYNMVNSLLKSISKHFHIADRLAR